MIKSLLLFLMILLLLTQNWGLVSVFPQSGYIVYIIIILVVFYLGNGIFWGKKLGVGLLFGASLIGIVFALEIITGWIKIDGFDFNFMLLISFFILQILVAVGEEISFRGYILKDLIDTTGIKTGISISSCMFAAIHIPSFIYYGLDIPRGTLAFIVTGLLGAIASIIYISYGLRSAIAFHFAWNFLQYNIFNLSKTQQGIMVLSYTQANRNFLTGGDYGPEAGIAGFIVVLFALMIFIKKCYKPLR
jgi:membrane protease YdiL (CAAX protease family)